jgi:zinc transporter, ZIP family
MANLGPSIGWGLVVGLSLLAGAVAAARLRLPVRVAATLTAFGGGVLLAAVALELVPDADAEAGPALTALGLAAGTLVYVGADSWLSRRE